MKFKTIAEAFNFWNTKTIKEIEARAAEIKNQGGNGSGSRR